MAMITVDASQFQLPGGVPAALTENCCRLLEQGGIVYFPISPLRFDPADLVFLRTRKPSDSTHHKNIAYRPLHDHLTGFAGADLDRMRAVIRDFSRQAREFLTAFFLPYRFEVEYASFRPFEESGRQVRQNARNDLLHVDSFPTRPTGGKRILRFFTNIHSTQARVWKTGPDFSELAHRYAAQSGLLERYRRLRQLHGWRSSLARLGLPAHARPPYDEFMHGFHNWLKANQAFQQDPSHPLWQLAPGSSWIAFTDTCSHAVLSGRYALEQTMLVLPDSLLLPPLSPPLVLDSLLDSPPQP